jgi:hypothetical protein
MCSAWIYLRRQVVPGERCIGGRSSLYRGQTPLICTESATWPPIRHLNCWSTLVHLAHNPSTSLHPSEEPNTPIVDVDAIKFGFLTGVDPTDQTLGTGLESAN